MAKTVKAEVVEPVLKCSRCGTSLVNIISGAVCPKGCGGVFPKLTPEQQTVAVRELRRSDLPRAAQLLTIKAVANKDEGWCDTAVFVITDGPKGLFRRVPRLSASLTKKVQKDGALLAYCAEQDRIIALREFTAAILDVRAALDGDVVDGDAKVDQDSKEAVADGQAD
jgi:hypothetical protein